ncbi:two-component system sensor histidine kinase KdpD [Propionivibrio sp.]|uniref:two-component system sensor histidine kinase KdpD n=1 Tax=Propionivibrio sp. TaxID=2212460 RepID=UPI0025E2A6B8|nr:two-component system sensor histidine kinase KdpD [Propionivibrio sp.]MBK7357592.1 two-component system sensor histidine kinase KdpD [Propionivibrio sp.]MBK8745577.1 two-component system sensor histidine kinase KdpD [Propionivibrio sp.]
MIDTRPDPDLLLDKIKEEEVRSARGKLKIFFGASAGVGKTYAMLSAARQQTDQGTDVVIGVVETHGRKETEALLAGLERLPLRDVFYRDKVLKEFDIDGALARKPALILMDELAHSNVQGSRHPKRWQDVDELLSSGIDVYSTINVQHLETLNDVVGGITGIRVWETVPDHVFDAADEVVLVDLPPDELLQRLKEGKVYLPHQAERAIQNFFRKGNLIALRELALRRTADRVDSEMIQYRRDKSVTRAWQTRESLLACIGPGEGGDRIVRSAARVAAKLDVPWHVIYVETPELRHLSEKQRLHILKNLKMAQETGAETASLSGSDAVETIIDYARDHNLAKVIVGRDHVRAWRPWYRSFADRVGKHAPDLDVIQVAREESRSDRRRDEQTDDSLLDRLKAPWQSFAMSAVLCAMATVIAMPLHSVFDLANIAMLFLMAVVLAAVRYGLGPAVAAAFLNVAAFDFFFVPPRFSFAVSDVQYLMTFAVMLAVGLVTAKLTAGLKLQARVASRREQRIRALYEMSRNLSGALMPEQIAEISQRFAASGFDARAAIVLADEKDRLLEPIPVPGGVPAVDMGISQWSFDHGTEAGCGTDTLSGSPLLYIPLKAPMRTRGVLVLDIRHPQRLMAPEQRRLLDTFARLIAIAIERVHYVDVAQTTTVQMESERLRNSLLSAISHDLRTPLAALVGLADSMSMTQPPPTGQQTEIAISMREEALRMNSLVNNLLDMARLQSGAVKLNRQWQPLEEVVGSAIKATGTAIALHRVSVNLPDDLPLLEFDAVLIERVLSNLLENAAKYTPPGSQIVIGAMNVARDHVDIWVEDNGPGLPAGKEEEIFNKFARGQKESATPGVGLGLAICRAIVEAHGGSIRAENRRDGGARFVFSLSCGNPPVVDTTGADLASEEIQR